MAGIGNTFAKNNLDQDLGSGAPATWYVALLTALPADGDGTSLVEATWTGYARPSHTNNTTNWPAASVSAHIAGKSIQTGIDFGTISGLSGAITVVGIALYDAATSGNLGRVAVFGTPSSPVTYTLNNGSSLSIATGNLTFQVI